jgi:LacI family transcriptional regulator
VAIDDPEVSRAARFIREHACDGIKVEDVLAKVSLSRRVLETRFRKILGRSPHEQIQLLQLRRVEQLLRETDLPLAVVADRAGFIHTEYMSVVVKQKLGLPPSEYRQQHRDKPT